VTARTPAQVSSYWFRTPKQHAIAAELWRSPDSTDSAVARATGSSRSLVRRIRERLSPSPPAATVATDPSRTVPWRPALDPVFEPGGFADELELRVEELVTLGGRLDRRLAALETNARAHHLRHERHRLIREIYALARRLQRELVPVGPCPFCPGANGCARCTSGGWATEDTVDAGALLEDIHAKRRWWRPHRVQVPM
jgi:hypothetical protein